LRAAIDAAYDAVILQAAQEDARAAEKVQARRSRAMQYFCSKHGGYVKEEDVEETFGLMRSTTDCVCTECAEDSAEQEGEPAKKKAKKKTGKKTGKLSASALAFTPGGGGDDGDAREGIGDRGGDEEEEEDEEEDMYEQEFRKLQAKVVEVKIRVSCVGSESMIEIVNGWFCDRV